MINDINGLRAPGAVQTAAAAGVPVCLMHMAGEPRTMQQRPQYTDVVTEVTNYLGDRVNDCLSAGIKRDSIMVDPGIGFGKNLAHNLALLNAVDLIRREVGCAVLIGVSRKSLIDGILGRAVDQRLPASLGLAVQAGIKWS